ncbi:hypothetical protein BBC27_00675 [Acidithiobacillus ferrivorans]|uniref:Uncharacterized protein n=1 Tax=Acidithiobacillus ferrivorans TaxID=160808 RepID=A0A1B9C196_9PROT|nr:hypothetical protein BBC27_00675 [Acidithiobacillus ferrivorans]
MLAIAVILGCILVPRIHAYLYGLKAETVVTRYTGALHAIQHSIRNATAGAPVVFIRTSRHPGLFTNPENPIHPTARYAVGWRYTKIGVIYFSRAAYTLPPDVQFSAHYFHQDSSLAFLYENLFDVRKPLKWPTRTLSGDAAQDARDTCKGAPVVVVVGMNFDYHGRNKKLRDKISALLRKDGFVSRNDLVQVALNTRGAMCGDG